VGRNGRRLALEVQLDAARLGELVAYCFENSKAIGRTVDGEGDYSFRIDVRDNDTDGSPGITMSDGYASGAGTAPGET
jgi:hypothetical protein